MRKKHEATKRDNGKEPKHVHVETGPDKCLSYQVETTADVFQDTLRQASQRISEHRQEKNKD